MTHQKLNVEALCPSEKLLSTYKVTRCQNAEDHILSNDLRDNLRIYILMSWQIAMFLGVQKY